MSCHVIRVGLTDFVRGDLIINFRQQYTPWYLKRAMLSTMERRRRWWSLFLILPLWSELSIIKHLKDWKRTIFRTNNSWCSIALGRPTKTLPCFTEGNQQLVTLLVWAKRQGSFVVRSSFSVKESSGWCSSPQYLRFRLGRGGCSCHFFVDKPRLFLELQQLKILVRAEWNWRAYH